MATKFTKIEGFKYKAYCYKAGETINKIPETAYEYDNELDYINLIVVKERRWSVYEKLTGMSVGGGYYDTRKEAVANAKERFSNMEQNVEDFVEKTRKCITKYEVINPV